MALPRSSPRAVAPSRRAHPGPRARGPHGGPHRRRRNLNAQTKSRWDSPSGPDRCWHASRRPADGLSSTVASGPSNPCGACKSRRRGLRTSVHTVSLKATLGRPIISRKSWNCWKLVGAASRSSRVTTGSCGSSSVTVRREPARTARFAAELARRLRPAEVEAVCGPLVGGALLAQAVAAHLDAAFLYAEPRPPPEHPGGGLYTVRYRVPGAMRARAAGRAVAIVDDVANAGSATRATHSELRDAGARRPPRRIARFTRSQLRDRVVAVSRHLVTAAAAVDRVACPVAGGDRVVAAAGQDLVLAGAGSDRRRCRSRRRACRRRRRRSSDRRRWSPAGRPPRSRRSAGRRRRVRTGSRPLRGR